MSVVMNENLVIEFLVEVSENLKKLKIKEWVVKATYKG